jgi:hypothetical protein
MLGLSCEVFCELAIPDPSTQPISSHYSPLLPHATTTDHLSSSSISNITFIHPSNQPQSTQPAQPHAVPSHSTKSHAISDPNPDPPQLIGETSLPLSILPLLPLLQLPPKFLQNLPLLNPPILQPSPQFRFSLGQTRNLKLPHMDQRPPARSDVWIEEGLDECWWGLEGEIRLSRKRGVGGVFCVAVAVAVHAGLDFLFGGGGLVPSRWF